MPCNTFCGKCKVENGKPTRNYLVSGRKRLLDYGFDNLNPCDTYMYRDDYMRTPLMRAVEGNQHSVVRYVLSRGVNLDAHSTTNRNILHYVAESGNLTICDMLLAELKVRYCGKEVKIFHCSF